MEFHNPNDYWMHHDKYKDMDDDERLAVGFIQGITYVIMMIIALAFCAVLFGCTSTEYVQVPEYHEVHHHHTDSIFKTDSIVRETTTTILQTDSAAMSQYGIQLKAAERAWLIRTAELERQIQMIDERHTDTVHERDSVPYSVEVIKTVEVEKPLAWWQKVLMWLGGVCIVILLTWVWRTK